MRRATSKTEPYAIRWTAGLKHGLQHIAKQEGRSLANFTERELWKVLEQHGLLPCDECMGSGVEAVDGDEPVLCDGCNGFGYRPGKVIKVERDK